MFLPKAGEIGPIRRRIELEPMPEQAPIKEPSPAPVKEPEKVPA